MQLENIDCYHTQPLRTMRNSKKPSWNRALLIALLILLALLLIFSRGYRAARRAVMPQSRTTTESDISELSKQTDVNDTRQQADLQKPTETMLYNIDRDMLLGFIEPARDTGFVKIIPEHASREGMYMREEAYKAFVRMREAAMMDGVELWIISATRNFNHQKRIWENKWEGRQQLFGGIYATDIADPVERAREILRFSAMPGTSRHHWGTDIDLNSLQNAYFESGQGKKVYNWLLKNAAEYGFCQPYTTHGKNRQGGYEEEKWHWSYMPVASGFLSAFKEMVSYDDIKGFSGWETAAELEVIEDYVLEINSDCL